MGGSLSHDCAQLGHLGAVDCSQRRVLVDTYLVNICRHWIGGWQYSESTNTSHLDRIGVKQKRLAEEMMRQAAKGTWALFKINCTQIHFIETQFTETQFSKTHH